MLSTRNWQSWSRFKRLDLRDFALALGNSAMQAIDHWPTSGEGRAVKAASESVLRLTDTHSLGGIVRLCNEFTAVLIELRGISQNTFFKQILSGNGFSDRNGVRRLFRGALENIIEDCEEIVRELSTSPSAELNLSPIVVDRIGRIVPDQKFGAILFRFHRGKVRVEHVKGNPVEGADELAERARKRLIRDARQLMSEMESSNVDRRITHLVADVLDDLKNKQDIIQVGISCITITSYCNKFDSELPSILSAQLHGFAISLTHYVGQFEDWGIFTENSALSDLSDSDLTIARQAAASFADGLEAQSTHVLPEVPQSLRRLIEAIREPGKASKRAAWATIRAMENLVSVITRECVSVIKSTFKGVNKGLEKGTSIVVIGGLLTAAVAAVSTLSPTLLISMKAEWLKQLLELMIK